MKLCDYCLFICNNYDENVKVVEDTAYCECGQKCTHGLKNSWRD